MMFQKCIYKQTAREFRQAIETSHLFLEFFRITLVPQISEIAILRTTVNSGIDAMFLLLLMSDNPKYKNLHLLIGFLKITLIYLTF